MPEYLSPGVYVEEFEIGAKPIEGVGTSTAGFIGMTERGPVQVKLVTSLSQYMDLYGGYIKDSYMTYAVEGFFSNGGQRCFIARVARTGAHSASYSGAFNASAVGPGIWGVNLAIRIEKASSGGAGLFKLIVGYWRKKPESFQITGDDPNQKAKKFQEILEASTKIEVYDGLTWADGSPDNVLKRINGISGLISVSELSGAAPDMPETGDAGFVSFSGGDDGAADLTRADMNGDPAAAPGERTGLTAFKEVDEIALVYSPDVYSPLFTTGNATFVDDILSHCESLKDRFALLDAPSGQKDISGLSITTAPLRPSKYGAVYYPWIKVLDPITNRTKLIPPGGHMTGIYARTDIERGVHKAPANALVRGALDLEFQISKGEQDLLNPRHINCIRFFQGQGILVWGARTLILDALWKYINVRRLFIYLEESIQKGTQWVVFEPNDARLWARVKQTITQFLTGVWKSGALMGSTPEESFFVKCDRTTMSQDDIDNGRLICIIGVAPVKPAEFVIFRIAQWQGGSAATE